MLVEVGLYTLKLTGKNRWSSLNVFKQSEIPDKPNAYKQTEATRVLTKAPDIPVMITDFRILITEWIHLLIEPNIHNVPPPPMPPHVPYGLRGLPSRLWPECNRLLRLGHPLGAVTLSR
jgi:hypothetical protein